MKATATLVPQTTKTPAISRYAQYLKKVYIRSKLPVKNKWPPTPSKKIIKLAAVEKEGGASKAERAEFVRASSVDEMIEKKELVPLQLEDILNTHSSSTPKCVLVEGAPGIGKSTFAWKACRKWAKGKLFREYDLVVLLQMRDKKVKEAKNLVDLFYHLDAKLSSEVAQEVSDREGKGVLLIFEAIFPESELPRKFESLGLMQSATELSTDTGMSVSINFLHITIQEFLAAYHLSLQPHQEQLKFLRECSQLPRFANVVGFLCGLTQFSSSVWQCLHSLITSYNSRGDLLILDRQGLNLLHWLHEVQAPHTFLKTNCIRFCPNYMTQLSPLDFHVLGYCISHSNCSWHLDISRANFDSTSVKMICNSCTLVGSNSAGATGRISVLKAYSLDCCHQVLCSISELPHTILQGLETIDLGDNNFMSLDRLATVLETICLPHLETLNLGNTSVGNGGAVALLRALRTSSSTISNLCLSGSGIGHNDAEELRELLVASHTLSCLDINANPFSSESLQLISIGLAISTSLASLDLSYIKFDQPAIEHLSAALGVNHTLRKLNLTCCGIDNDGAYNLAEVLEGNKALEVLFINRNEVGEDGARAFAEMLKKNQSLKKLSLADESIRFGGVFTLIAALEHNDTLEMLFLHNKCNPPELTLNYRSSFCEPDFVCFPDLFHELLVW